MAAASREKWNFSFQSGPRTRFAAVVAVGEGAKHGNLDEILEGMGAGADVTSSNRSTPKTFRLVWSARPGSRPCTGD